MSEVGRPRPPLWAWPSVLSLDAPTVAVAWAWTLARVVGAPFGGAEVVAISAGTAAVYLADRARDAGRLTGERPIPWRHALAARHRRAVTLAAAACGLTAAASAVFLAPASVLWGAALTLAAAGLLAAARRGRGSGSGRGRRRGRPAWRPAAVGTLFAAGTALPLAAAGPEALLRAAPALAGLAAVATLNVALIAAWERRLDDGATTFGTAHVGRRGRLLAGAALTASLLGLQPVLSALGPALALGAATLTLLEAVAPSEPRPGQAEALHLAADAALLLALLAVPAV